VPKYSLRKAPLKESYPKIYLYKRIVQAKLFIDQHFAEPMELDNISGEAYFSKFHFLRLFKKIYGKTPHQYLTFVRIEQAKQMLTHNQPVAVVSFAVGYESISSFTGLFKRIVGLTPSQYQQQQSGIKADMAHTPLKFIPPCFTKTTGPTQKSNFQEVG